MGPVVDVAKPPIPKEAFERFPNRWIALREGEIVADAATEDELRRDDRVESTDTIFLVPAPSTYFYPTRPA